MMDFIQKIFIFETENLVLDQGVVGFSVFLLLKSLFLLIVVATDHLRVLTHFFLQILVDFKQLNLGIELLRNIVVVTSEVDKSISFAHLDAAQFILMSKW